MSSRKIEFIAKVNSMLKLVRTEYSLTQDKMAAILGISKKTLVESEKGRRSLGWTECVALCTIFSDSSVLNNALGGDPTDMIQALAFSDARVNYPATMGGRVWWRVIEEKNGYRIQQNYISQHYRLLDNDNHRIISSFELEEVQQCLNDLA